MEEKKRAKNSKVSYDDCLNAVRQVLERSMAKKRNFVETVELQISMKNIDVQRDKRFQGTVKLSHIPCPNMTVCVFGDAKHYDEAMASGMEAMTLDDLKKLNKDKKLVKKLSKKYDAFLASETIIKQIPRILGPGLTKSGKFPTPVGNEQLVAKADELRSTAKIQLKKVLCMGLAVGNLEMTEEQIAENTMRCINLAVSLPKKNWQNISSLYVKSTMGKPVRIY